MTAVSCQPDLVTGDITGVALPAHPEAILGNPEEFLTRAFHAYGSLSLDNAVARVTHCESFAGGNSGKKLALTVEYARAEPGLHDRLFAKFSRHFDDPFRDRRRYELEPEIRLAALSRLPAFPVPVARPYFADFNHESGTGLLVTERIAFGQGAVEPLHPKCKDHLLDNPLEHYRAIVGSLARLAAAHKSRRLSPWIEELFTYDAVAAAADMPILLDEAGLCAKVERWAEFVARNPRIVPQGLTNPEFFARMERDALDLHRREREVRRFLHEDPDFVALCHWNANIDNAWFWREADGALRCGLLDWGMARQMNVGYSLWGSLSASGSAFLEGHLDALLGHFAAELAVHGGPLLDPERLALHFDLSVAILGLALMMDTPALVEERLPEVAEAEGPLDPLLERDQVVHGFLHVSTNFLNLWRCRDFGASLRRMPGRQ